MSKNRLIQRKKIDEQYELEDIPIFWLATTLDEIPFYYERRRQRDDG